jgi:hypothetical protein
MSDYRECVLCGQEKRDSEFESSYDKGHDIRHSYSQFCDTCAAWEKDSLKCTVEDEKVCAGTAVHYSRKTDWIPYCGVCIEL